MERTTHSRDVEAVKSAWEAVAAVDAPGRRWMMVMWEVKEGRVELTKMITSHFPTGDFLPAVGQLAETCHKEMLVVGKAATNEPLPTIVPRKMMEGMEEYIKRVNEVDGVLLSGGTPKPTAEQRQRAKETMEQAMRGAVDMEGTVEPLPAAAPRMMMEGTEEQPPELEDVRLEDLEDEEVIEADFTPPLPTQPEDDDEA